MRTQDQLNHFIDNEMAQATAQLAGLRRLTQLCLLLSSVLRLGILTLLITQLLVAYNLFDFDSVGGAILLGFLGIALLVSGLVTSQSNITEYLKQTRLGIFKKDGGCLFNLMVVGLLVVVAFNIQDYLWWLWQLENDLIGSLSYTGGFLLLGGLLARLLSRVKGRFNSQFLEHVAVRLVRYLMPGAEFNATGGIAQEQFSDSQLFFHKRISKYQTAEHITWQGSDQTIEYSWLDVNVQQVFPEKGNSQRHVATTVFTGSFFHFRFNEAKHWPLLVLSYDDSAPLTAEVDTANAKKARPDLQYVRLEEADEAYEKEFNTYTLPETEAEARALANGYFLKRLLALHGVLQQNVHVALQGNEAWLAIEADQGYFTPQVFGKTFNAEQLRSLLVAMQYLRELPSATPPPPAISE